MMKYLTVISMWIMPRIEARPGGLEASIDVLRRPNSDLILYF